MPEPSESPRAPAAPPTPPQGVRRLLGSSVALSLALAAATTIWVGSGVVSGQEAPAEKPPAEIGDRAAEAPTVRTREVSSRPLRAVRTFPGLTEARRDLSLRSEVEGEVEELLAREGERVEAGGALLRLAAQDRPAGLADARARLEQARTDADAAERLFAEGFRSEAQVQASRAALAAAEAGIERARLQVRRLVIDAPFAGVLEEFPVELGDFVSPGTVVARLLDLDPLVLSFSVSENDLAVARPGAPVRASLSSGGEVEGRIVFVSRIADPATRSFRVEAEAPNPGSELPAGVTARVSLELPERRLHPLPPASLVLDDSGALGVFGVEGDGTAAFHPVDVVHQDDGGAWAPGLPDPLRLVVVGQGWILDGQRVDAVDEGAVEAASEDAGSAP